MPEKKVEYKKLRTEFFIPGNTPSSKNSKQWTGKYLISSKSTQRFKKQNKLIFQTLKKDFLQAIKNKEKPYKIAFYFIRDSKRKFDYINVAQIIQDEMVDHGWLDDDNMAELIPVFQGYKVDKVNAGCFIEVLD